MNIYQVKLVVRFRLIRTSSAELASWAGYMEGFILHEMALIAAYCLGILVLMINVSWLHISRPLFPLCPYSAGSVCFYVIQRIDFLTHCYVINYLNKYHHNHHCLGISVVDEDRMFHEKSESLAHSIVNMVQNETAQSTIRSVQW
jgi:hypothetical protein